MSPPLVTLVSVAGKPANIDFYASTMRVTLALLHEEDLLRFLGDLRNSGNAYYAVKRCAITRTGQAATGAGLVPRLRAECEIDLITVLDVPARKEITKIAVGKIPKRIITVELP